MKTSVLIGWYTWEGDIDKIQAKEDSAITRCAAFQKPLPVPKHVTEEFTTRTIVGVLGESDKRFSYCCVKCNRCVKADKAQKIVTCENDQCKLVQKLQYSQN